MSKARKFPQEWSWMSTVDRFLSRATYLIEKRTKGRGPRLVLVPECYEEGYSVENDPRAEHTIFGIRIYRDGYADTKPSYTSTIPGEALAELIADMTCRAMDNSKGE